ncbi:MAG TPA: histidinol-phosphate transaminase [Actinomycetota bacterium]|nr:histidinol-phosphate transaminase [Actinomycetota bacterium]
MSRPRPDPRPEIAALRPYRPSAQVPPVRLHANESPLPPPKDVLDEVLDAIAGIELNRYPDPEALELRYELAAYTGLERDWIWTGTGSNEILLNACLAYGGAGRTALLFAPTYAMHRLQATVAGMRIETVPRRDNFLLDLEASLEAIDRLRPEIVFVCTPDNPTGAITFPEDIAALAHAAPGLVVVDEAYYEFAGVTFTDHLQEFGNVIVVRTLSKAFGLAGARIGYALAQPDTLAPLLAVRMPYGLSALAQVTGVTVLRHRERLLENVQLLVTERDRLIAELESMDGITAYPSLANFVLFRAPDADAVVSGLAARGIAVRDMTHIEGGDGCVRVTAGMPEQNDAFLAGLRELV